MAYQAAKGEVITITKQLAIEWARRNIRVNAIAPFFLLFDRRISSFQAIQHYCANIAMDVQYSSLTTYEAAWQFANRLPASQEVAMAKAWISQALRRVIALAHEIHGAVGFTEDHDLPLYFGQAKAWEVSLSDVNFDLDRIAVATEI